MLGRPFIWVLPLVFPALMIVGGGFGVAGISLPLAEAIIGIFGVFHGYAHGIELPSAASPAAYAVGFLLTTVLLHLVGVSVGLLTQVPRGAALLRASGYVMAPAGAWLLLSAAHVL